MTSRTAFVNAAREETGALEIFCTIIYPVSLEAKCPLVRKAPDTMCLF